MGKAHRLNKKLASCYSPIGRPIVPSPFVGLTSVFGTGIAVTPQPKNLIGFRYIRIKSVRGTDF